ncbi:MAG TPA: hypothetical protein VIY99_02300 [Terracidiphilus sp.]
MKRFVREKVGQVVLLGCVTGSALAVALGQCREPSPEKSPLPVQAIRAIDDSALSGNWLLIADRKHAGAPGRLVAFSGRDPDWRRDLAVPPAPRIIRGGDRVLVEQDSAAIHARLDAVALGPAAAGEVLTVRLATTGKALRVQAVAPGRVTLCEIRP